MPGMMFNVTKRPDELKPHGENVKIYGEENIDRDLADSIKEKGILEPLVIKDDNTIVSGHRRWLAAKNAGLEKIPCRTIVFDDDLDEVESLIEFNRQREKIYSQRMAEGDKLKEIHSERARRRQEELAGTRPNLTKNSQDLATTLSQGHTNNKRDRKNDTDYVVAEQLGMSVGNYKKANTVWRKAKEGDEKVKKIVERVDKGEMSINKAYNEIKKKEKQQEKEEVKQKIESEPKEKKNEVVTEVKNGWYKVGKQYLYVGSNLDKEFRDFVPQCRFAFADPPYNAGVDEWDHNFKWEQDFLQDIADIVAITPGGWNTFDFYNQTKMNYIWEMCCWIKNGMTHGRCGYANFIKTSIFSKDKVKIPQDFWSITIKPSETEETKHKGRKPYDFIIHLIDVFSKKGDCIIDPFAGSGTTLLTSEYMGRISYNAELDKAFCVKIINRALERGMKHERL